MSRVKGGQMKKKLNLPNLRAIEGLKELEPISSLCEPLLNKFELINEASKLVVASKETYFTATTHAERVWAVVQTFKANKAIEHLITNGDNDIYTAKDFQ
jgi:hypothetical protein